MWAVFIIENLIADWILALFFYLRNKVFEAQMLFCFFDTDKNKAIANIHRSYFLRRAKS